MTEASPAKDAGIASQFRAFLENYGVIGLAIAFVIGAALTSLVKAVVEGLLMPIVGALLPGGSWREATWQVGPFDPFQVGRILGETLNFLIIAAFVFLVAKAVLGEAKVGKK
ncbi:MAG TPA: MscL family protein [Candidatus Thermoplasmatota archaeon]|nr:MscL family protein [Candidatus Thermoplasmatota archaeon]